MITQFNKVSPHPFFTLKHRSASLLAQARMHGESVPTLPFTLRASNE
jgi:hypothetical protein